MMHAITLLSAVDATYKTKQQSQSQLLHCRGNALRMVQWRLAMLPEQQFDSAVAGIACLAIFEVKKPKNNERVYV
jgi:hypothetical protein